MGVGTGEMSVGAAAVCVGALVWLMGGRQSGARRAQLLFAGGGAVGVGPPSWERAVGELRRIRGRLRAEWWSLAVGVVLAVLGASVVPVVAGAVGVPLLRRVRLAGEARRARELCGDAVIALCSALAGEVRAGRQPGRRCCGRRVISAGSVRRRPRCWRRRGSAGTCRVRSRRRHDSRAGRACWGWPRAGGWLWIRGPGSRRDSTGSKGRCVPTGTNGPIFAPSWRGRGPQR